MQNVNTMQKYLDEARRLDAKFAAQADKVRQDRELSIEGKTKRLQALEADRRAAVQELQAEAADVREYELAAAQKRLAAERSRLAEERRTLLGDTLYAQLLQAELSVADGGEILQRILGASSPWERELVRSYAGVELRRRTADRAPDAAEVACLQQLRYVQPDSLQQLEREADTLAGFDMAALDRQAYQKSFADRYGVQVQQVAAIDMADVDGAE